MKIKNLSQMKLPGSLSFITGEKADTNGVCCKELFDGVL